jgi:hypothetical protein
VRNHLFTLEFDAVLNTGFRDIDDNHDGSTSTASPPFERPPLATSLRSET